MQAGVNSFDAVTVSGNAAAANTDPLVYNSMYAFYTACASFMSRNLGAGKKDRVLKSYFICLTYAFAIGALLGGLFLLFGQQFLSLFATEPAVIEAGKERLYIMSFSYGDFRVYGWLHRGFPRNRKEYSADGHCHFRILRVPRDLGIHNLRPFSHTYLAVPALLLLLDHYRGGRSGVLLEELQEDCNLKIWGRN